MVVAFGAGRCGVLDVWGVMRALIGLMEVVIVRGGRVIEVCGGFIWLGRGIFVILWCY